MAEESEADELREMALHRGYKLVRSRRRKPGTGDYGKYGLTDAAGKPLLGISENGLVATAKDVEAFLRSGAESIWRQSAETTPDRPKAETPSAEPPAPAAKRRAARNPKPPTHRTAHNSNMSKAEPSNAMRTHAAPSPAKARKTRAAAPEPEPELTLRAAKPADADSISSLMSQLKTVALDTKAVTAHLAHIRKSGGGVILAEIGEMVGCCAWIVVPTLHRGSVGRLATLLVDEGHRRRGIGKALLEKAMAELNRRGVMVVEAMSDIDLRNAHNFFRSCGFEQISYRFARKAG